MPRRVPYPGPSPFPALPVVVGHRGSGKGLGPGGVLENTLPSMLRAVEDGAAWLEFDVQQSADGQLVLYHAALCDGEPLRSLPASELRRRGLNTLDDVAAGVPSHIGFVIEIKVSLPDLPGAAPDIVATVAEWVKSSAGSRQVVLSSFCPTLFQVDLDVPLGRATNFTTPYDESITSAARLGAAVAVVHAADVLVRPDHSPPIDDLRAAIARAGLSILAWGVEPDYVEPLLAAGVTALCGDDVPGLVAAVR